MALLGQAAPVNYEEQEGVFPRATSSVVLWSSTNRKQPYSCFCRLSPELQVLLHRSCRSAAKS